MKEEKIRSSLFGKISVIRPCSLLVYKHLVFLVFVTQEGYLLDIGTSGICWYFWSQSHQALPFWKLPSWSNPISLNTHVPFQIRGCTQIQQTPHLQITESMTKPLQLKSQICNLTEVSFMNSQGNDCAFVSYFLLTDATTHNAVVACNWQKWHGVIWKS